jgi:hypothetical protein
MFVFSHTSADVIFKKKAFEQFISESFVKLLFIPITIVDSQGGGAIFFVRFLSGILELE